MKSMYLVKTGKYSKTDACICKTEEDAIFLATCLNREDNLSTKDLKDYIVELPYIGEDQTFDVNDIVMTAIASTERFYKNLLGEAMNQNNSSNISDEE